MPQAPPHLVDVPAAPRATGDNQGMHDDAPALQTTAPAPDAPFEDHVAWARATPVQGFDLTPVAGRCTEDPLPWDYAATARALVRAADGPVLDLGTGDGEAFAALAPLPAGSAATVGWPPSVPVARRRLEPLGVEVRQVGTGATDGMLLPFFDDRYAVVLDRHEEHDPQEVRRVLRPGGTFCTQQVDTRDGIRLNAALGAPLPWDPDLVTLDTVVDGLVAEGLEVVDAREHTSARRFTDLGAVLWYLRVAAWQVPDLATLSPEAVARYEAPLRALHLHLASGHPFVDEAPRILVVARRPG